MKIRRTLSHGCSGTLLLMSFALTVSDARAGSFQIRTHSAKGLGLSLAGVAAGGQLSYSYWNPATLSEINRWQAEGVASGVFPSISITPSAATNALVGMLGGVPSGKTEIGRTAIVPASYMAMPVGDRTTIGVSITSPFGLSTSSPWGWAGQIYSRESEILSVNINPMISYRINDMISIGGGLQFEYFRSYLTQAEGLGFNASSAVIKADDIGVGFNFGVQLRPWSGGTVGIGYRSAITHNLDGHLEAQGLPIPAEAKLATPDIVSFGLRQNLSSRTRLMGTVEWSNWSRLGTVPVYAAGTGAVLTNLPLRYRDGWLFAIGGEYDASESLTLRGGLGYEIAPMNDVSRDTRLPETNQFIVSAGLSYKYSSRLSFDLSYTHAIGLGDGPVTIGPADPRFLGLPFQASSSLGVGIVSIAATYGF
jgi:long-chain fatty acid transport protein